MIVTKKTRIFGKDAGKKETSYTDGGNVN
jgi:hypothetical protein